MRAIWKGAISFGLVTIPVGLGVATRRSDPAFRTLDERTLTPVRQQFVASGDGEPVPRDKTVKGYEVSKGRFVVVSDEELESVAAERRHTIDLVAFVDSSEIDPVYYDRSYYVEPQEQGRKPYALLVEAMRETKKAALAKLVLSGKEHLALLRPADGMLVLELLFYPEDVRSADDLGAQLRGIELSDAERDMARQLVESLSRPFEPAEFVNQHKQAVMNLVDKKLAGETVVTEAPPEPVAAPDLMSALKASLDQVERTGGDSGQSSKGSNGQKRTRRAKSKSAQ